MENIERTQFVVLTGHLDDQPLPDLFRTLRVQRKSGRLQVEYGEAPGAFFFEEGQLVDAQLGSLRGLEAVHAALALRGASFNFNPLVRPPDRSIDRQGQKFISDLVEAPRREGLSEIKAVGGGYAGPAALPQSQQAAPLQLAPVPAEVLAPLEARLTAVEEAIVTSSRRLSRERLVYAVVISFMVGLTVVMAAQAIFNNSRNEPAPATTTTSAAPAAPQTDATAAATVVQPAQSAAATASPPKKEPEAAAGVERRNEAPAPKPSAGRKAEPSKVEQSQSQRQALAASSKETKKAAAGAAGRGSYVVNVLVQVKDGRVTSARVIDSRPSAGAYEAAALSKARERRYPENFTGGQRLRIVVGQ